VKTFYGRRFSRNRKNQTLDQNLVIESYVTEKNIKKKIRNFSKVFKCINLEIGFGNGDNLINLAVNNPDIGFVGCDPFCSGNVITLKKISSMSLTNILISNLDFHQFFKYLHNVKYDNIFVLFPDPWPKRKHVKRRLVNGEFYKMIKTVIKNKGQIFLKSDNIDYISEMVSLFLSDGKFSMVRTFLKKQNFFPLKYTKYAIKAVKNHNFPHLIVFQYVI
tara:strand:+ start:1483 stop:2139 length:657 start_codon:yes stop_codon:yes gene_type:complete